MEHDELKREFEKFVNGRKELMSYQSGSKTVKLLVVDGKFRVEGKGFTITVKDYDEAYNIWKEQCV